MTHVQARTQRGHERLGIADAARHGQALAHRRLAARGQSRRVAGSRQRAEECGARRAVLLAERGEGVLEEGQRLSAADTEVRDDVVDDPAGLDESVDVSEALRALGAALHEIERLRDVSALAHGTRGGEQQAAALRGVDGLVMLERVQPHLIMGRRFLVREHRLGLRARPQAVLDRLRGAAAARGFRVVVRELRQMRRRIREPQPLERVADARVASRALHG
jgi:hypothetical protein